MESIMEGSGISWPKIVQGLELYGMRYKGMELHTFSVY